MREPAVASCRIGTRRPKFLGKRVLQNLNRCVGIIMIDFFFNVWFRGTDMKYDHWMWARLNILALLTAQYNVQYSDCAKQNEQHRGRDWGDVTNSWAIVSKYLKLLATTYCKTRCWAHYCCRPAVLCCLGTCTWCSMSCVTVTWKDFGMLKPVEVSSILFIHPRPSQWPNRPSQISKLPTASAQWFGSKSNLKLYIKLRSESAWHIYYNWQLLLVVIRSQLSESRNFLTKGNQNESKIRYLEHCTISTRGIPVLDLTLHHVQWSESSDTESFFRTMEILPGTPVLG